MVIRRDDYIDVVPISSLVPHAGDGATGARISYPGASLEVWDGSDWSVCTARTAYWHDGEVVTLHGRGGIVECTPDHVIFTPTGEVPARDLQSGGACVLADQPSPAFSTSMTPEEAWLLGILTAEGHILPRGRARITCGDEAVLAQAAACWERVAMGTSVKSTGAKSAFSDRHTPVLSLNGNGPYLRLLRSELYTSDGHKRVPKRILNAEPAIQTEFLAAYNLGDGLRAGHGIDLFKSFRTTSPVLAAGLVYLARTTLGRRVSVYLQPGALGGGSSYLINLSSGLTPGNKGAHLRKPQEEIRKVERRPYQGWMYDLATESGRFAAGVGMVVVHNSPRRGMEFVTRKITNAVARIKLGLQHELALGSLEPQRDWGFAGDYVQAMWLMLQRNEPEDFVVATGQTHSVREFVELAFRAAGIDDWARYVRQDERFMRPSEVDLLVGDAGKARRLLGWTPTMAFPELVETMVAHDLELEQRRERNRRR